MITAMRTLRAPILATLAPAALGGAACADPFAPYAAPPEDRADAPGPRWKDLRNSAIVGAARARRLAVVESAAP